MTIGIKDESRLRILLLSPSVNETHELGLFLSHKFEVNVINDVHLLLDSIRAIPPNIIIAAANFDLEWIPKLRTYPQTHHLPIVQYTNSSTHRPKREYTLIDFDDYLDDAMSAQELAARISATVNGAHARVKIDIRERILTALDDATRSLSDPEEITLVAATLLGVHLNTNRCAYADVESDQDTFNLTGNYNNGVPSIVGRYTFTQFGTECLRLMRAGLPYIVEDSETDSRIEDTREAYRMTLIRSVICVPLMKNDCFVAAMAVHQKTPRVWRGDEVELLLLVANRCWESIERIRVARELSANEARYRILVETISAVVWHTDSEGKIISENPSWEAFTGQRFSEYSGWGWCNAIHPEDKESVLQVWKNAVQGLKRYETRYRLRRHDGEYRFVVANATPIVTNGKFREWIGNCVDVTEAKRVNDELRANDRRKDDFLAMLAHELRNPLAPIRHAAQLLEMVGSSSDSRLQKAIGIIIRQTDHMVSLVDDLLDVSRVNRGLVTLAKQPVDLLQVISNAIEQVQPLIDLHHHELALHIYCDEVFVMGDRSRLVQVFSNLLYNAAKYTPDQGKIDVTIRRESDRVIVEIVDNGIGIADELLPHVFDLFTQGQRSSDRSQGGLGLGLALVKSLVQLHEGNVTVYSKGDKQGSRFTVSLPVIDIAADELSLNTEMASQSFSAKHILIVDDNEDAANLIGMLLETAGHHTIIRHHANDAIEQVSDNMPQVCLLDIGLPEMDGYELAQRIRALPGGDDVLLIALTGYGAMEDRSKSMQAGFNYHLVKPCDPKELMNILSKIHHS